MVVERGHEPVTVSASVKTRHPVVAKLGFRCRECQLYDWRVHAGGQICVKLQRYGFLKLRTQSGAYRSISSTALPNGHAVQLQPIAPGQTREKLKKEVGMKPHLQSAGLNKRTG